MQEIIFYNGFNLLVDIVLSLTVGFFAYRAGIRTGYLNGYGEGQEDYREYAEHAGYAHYDNERADS